MVQKPLLQQHREPGQPPPPATADSGSANCGRVSLRCPVAASIRPVVSRAPRPIGAARSRASRALRSIGGSSASRSGASCGASRSAGASGSGSAFAARAGFPPPTPPARRLLFSVCDEIPTSRATAAPLSPEARSRFTVRAIAASITLGPRPRRGAKKLASPSLRSWFTARCTVERLTPSASTRSERRTPLSANFRCPDLVR